MLISKILFSKMMRKYVRLMDLYAYLYFPFFFKFKKNCPQINDTCGDIVGTGKKKTKQILNLVFEGVLKAFDLP